MPRPTPPTPPPIPLPSPFSAEHTTLLAQGAEAHLYKTTFLTHTTPCLLKYRPPKPYRHPTLDARLTRARILAEARVLSRCRRAGVRVPAVLGAGWDEGWVALEWIEGWTVRRALDEWEERMGGWGEMDGEREVRGLLRRLGEAVGRLHAVGMVHGDLTTSNAMLRPSGMEEEGPEGVDKRLKESLEGEVVLIDFGLAGQTAQDEDRAVDLYVLERAFGSTHPASENIFADEVLGGYAKAFKGGKAVLRKLEGVRMRGRKKSMLG